MSPLHPRTVPFSLALIFCIPSLAIAVVTSNSPGGHVVTPSQAEFGMNLDGVGVLAFGPPNPTWVELTPFCTASLITDRHVLTAAHCFDSNYDGQIDPFMFAFDDPVIGFESAADAHAIRSFSISAIQFAPRWPEYPADVAVLTFDDPLPEVLPRYPLYGGSREVGRRAVLVGYGQAGSGALGVDLQIPTTPPVKRAGLNRYDAVLGSAQIILGYDFDSGLDENNVMAIDGFDSDLGFGDDEVGFAKGDSGGPSFIHGAIGAVTFEVGNSTADYTDEFDGSWGEVGYNARVSQFRQFILDATDGEAVFLNVLGDLNFNGDLDVSDLNDLTQQIRRHQFSAAHDLDDNGSLDLGDHRHWITYLKHTWYGDANLDGKFNSRDFTHVFLAGEYEDTIEDNSGWAEGDWNADGDFTSEDMIAAFLDGGYEQGSRPSVRAVPEPTSLVLIAAGVFVVAGCWRRTGRRPI